MSTKLKGNIFLIRKKKKKKTECSRGLILIVYIGGSNGHLKY